METKQQYDGQEPGYEATKYTLGGYCEGEPDSRQSVYPRFVLVCTTPAGYNTSHAQRILPHTGNKGI